MATYAHSTTAPVVQRSLSRTAGAPCRVLTSDELLAEIAGEIERQAALLPTPTPLPSLATAFSRRRAIFGAVVIAAAPVAVLASTTHAATASVLSANDARLVTLAAELRAVGRAADDHVASMRSKDRNLDNDPVWDAILDGFDTREAEVAALPADTMVGILAKVQVSRESGVAGCENGIDASIVDDLARLHCVGVVAHV